MTTKTIEALEAARDALEPFADAAMNALADDERDASSIWESPAAMEITAGHLRRAKSAFELLTTTHKFAALSPATSDRDKALEEAAALIEPKRPRPCDCDRCYCEKSDDAMDVGYWDAESNCASAIRALKEGK
jgi:hypothetical protein